MDGERESPLSLSLSLLPLEKGRIGRRVGLSDGVYKMRRLSFPNPLIWIFSDSRVRTAAVCASAPPPLVLGDIYLLKERLEVVTKDVGRNFSAAFDDDESIARHATSGPYQAARRSVEITVQ